MAERDPQIAHMLGVAYLQSGRHAEGIEALRKAGKSAPASAPILGHLGVALCQSGNRVEGIAALRKAVLLAPGTADIRNNLAHALNESGDHRTAAVEYRTLINVAPQMTPVWQGLVSALHKSGDLDGAFKAAEEAVMRFPQNSGLFATLGRVLMDLRRAAGAEDAFRKALALNRENAEAASNLGTLIEQQGRQQEALALYELAVRARPELADAWFNLGSCHEKLGDLPKAKPALERCASLRPSSAKALGALISARRKLCDWQGLDEQVNKLLRLVHSAGFEIDPEDAPAPFGLLSLMIPAEDQLRAAGVHSRSLVRKAEAWLPAAGAFQPSQRPLEGRRIRIGYLSPDLREHPAAYLMAGVFEAHDRERFEISVWSAGPDDGSAIRKRIELGVERFEDIRDKDIGVSTKLMRAGELDILVDLAGYTTFARPEILALRAAPIQVSYLGYPGSMGAPFIDYILADEVVAGEGDERFYSERVIRLPDCYFPTDDKAAINPDPISRANFGLPDHAFVFCCFCMNYKIDAPVLDAWTAILRQVPNAVLWLYRTHPAAADNLYREFAARGIGRDRVIFADRLAKAGHLARHRLADLFLDTFAYGAHTTAIDALWAGLPVLTGRGDTFARRVGASIVRAAGMPQLVTESVEAYIAEAVEIGTKPGRSAALKAQLRENIPHCPLFSTSAIARNLEAAYLGMIADFTKQNEPI